MSGKKGRARTGVRRIHRPAGRSPREDAAIPEPPTNALSRPGVANPSGSNIEASTIIIPQISEEINSKHDAPEKNPVKLCVFTAPDDTNDDPIVAAWADAASELAVWTDRHLVNRRDAFGHYIEVESRRHPDQTAYTDKSSLTLAVLARHFEGQSTGDLIGLHSTARDDLQDAGKAAACRSRWLAIDIDRHDDTVDSSSTWKAAETWYDRALELGFRPLLFDSNGQGGYHLLLVFDGPVVTELVHHFGKWLVCDWNEIGLAEEPEVFPKQPSIEPEGFGNWLRLPGRHHTRDHFTRVRDATVWLEGWDAVQAILRTTGTPAVKIPVDEIQAHAAKSKKLAPSKLDRGLPPGDPDRDALLAREALSHVTHLAGDYKGWVDVGMMLTSLGDAGLSLWDEWSRNCPEKYKPGLCERKWRTMRPAGGLGLGTLFHIAKLSGWPGPAHRNGRHAPGKTTDDPAGGASSVEATEGGSVGSVGFVGACPERVEATEGGSVGFVGGSTHTFPEIEALTVTLRPVPKLDERLLPDPFRCWIKDIAERACCPLDLPAVSALVSVASVVGRKVAIRPKRHDDWTVVPNLWGMGVLPPGWLKTHCLEEPKKPLARLEREARDEYAAALQDHAITEAVATAQTEAAKAALKDQAKKKKTEAELREFAVQSLSKPPLVPPTLRRYVINDATVEKLGELLAENPDGLLLYRDELMGFLKNLEKQGREGDRAFFLEAWNGTGSYSYDRIGRGSLFIPSNTVSILGGIQPGKLAAYIRGAGSGENDDGLISRFQLAVYPDVDQPFVNVDRWPDTQAKDRAYAVFTSLASLDPASIGATVDAVVGIPYLRFADDAQAFFDGWRIDLETKVRSSQEASNFTSHLSKHRSLMPSLALLFHLTEVVSGSASGLVSLTSARRSVAWCQYLEEHARRIYQAAFDGDAEPAQRLGERLKSSLQNPFKARDVLLKGWKGLTTKEEVDRTISILEGRGWVVRQEIPTTPGMGGRPTEVFHVNPALLEGDSSECLTAFLSEEDRPSNSKNVWVRQPTKPTKPTPLVYGHPVLSVLSVAQPIHSEILGRASGAELDSRIDAQIASEPTPEPGKRGPKFSPAFDVHPDLLGAPEITANTAITPSKAPNEANSGNSGNSRRFQESNPAPDREVFEL